MLQIFDNISPFLSLNKFAFYRLVIAVARDLQKDFYEYFPQFLSEIICLLQTKDSERIEYTFMTLAYLFKFLWRYLIRNISNVIILLLPLLADTQPVYINRFAAESFAFVVRKIKDKDSFLKLVLHALEDNASGLSGCGKLLFEVIAGTPGQFHSCAEQMLSLYLNTLQDESVNRELTYKVLREIVACILQNVHPQKWHVMWSVMLKVMDAFVEKSKRSSETSNEKEREGALVPLLRLIRIIVDHKNGKFLTDAAPLMKRLIVMLDVFNRDNGVLREVVNVSVAIFLAPDVKLMQENSSQLLLKIMAVNDVELLHFAVEGLIPCTLFEMLVLPHVLRRTVSIGFDGEALILFAKIISAKASPCLNGVTLDKWRKYVLDVRSIGRESVDYLALELETLTADVSLDAARILIILPHLKPSREELNATLRTGFLSLYEKISKYEYDTEKSANIDKIAFTFLLTLESMIHTSEPDDLHEFLVKSDAKIIELANKHHDNKYILSAIDLCLTYFSTSRCCAHYINSATFDALHENIVTGMSSPYDDVRLLVAHAYSLFADVEELGCARARGKSAMELVYLAERTPATVQKYREKLLHLQALEFQSDAIAGLDPKYHRFPLRCLMGNLYVNFSLLWEPVSAVLAGYANKECPQFWPTFLAELTAKSVVAERERRPSFDCHIVSALAARIGKCGDKPDLENRKLLLWKCMAHFSHYAETKNRDLAGLFIDFVNANFFKSNSEDGKACNIEKRKELSATKEDEESDDEERTDETATTVTQTDATGRNYKVKLLIAQMEIFDKVLNPRMMYREAEMRQIYLDLLSSKNADVQKATLNCLFAYKDKYLLPYRESLYGLVSERNLKNELARFQLDHESDAIQEEHRADLIPIVMRIIYAKMVAKTGMRTGGKAGGSARRKIVLRFLAGTREYEMLVFVRMAFRSIKSYASLDAEMDGAAFDLGRHTESIVNALDLRNVTPPRRMQSAANLLAIVIEQFGGKMPTRLLPRLLGTLICILAEVTGILQRSEEVYAGYLPTVRSVRTRCIDILARFFAHYEDYDWRRHELDALYDVAVFPWLRKLPVEGIHSPTALLKLFVAWGQNSRYYPLFVKHRADDESVSPLPYVVQLLANPKTHRSVMNAILEIVEKLLTLQDYGKGSDEMQVDGAPPFLPLTPVLTNLLRVEERILAAGANYGSAILLPHVPHILDFVKCRLKRSNKNVSRTELVILSRISEFVTDAETCDTLLTLILPVLIKKATLAGNNNEEAITGLLTTVVNLIKIVVRPESHLRAVAPLVGLVSDITTRKLLLQLYDIVAEKCAQGHREAMTRDCGLLIALNAWDRKWIDQPDFQKRLDAFGEITGAAERNEITLEFGVAMMHNCFHFLKTESDLAMRDCSGRCLKFLGSSLTKRHKSNASNRRYLLDDTILVLARKGIASRNEVVRLQSIALLGYMAAECADAHPVLRDLSPLVNRADPEVDFFENMQHLQLHRRARALLKFCTLAKTLERPINPKTLTQFILPLCSSYLCNEAFVNKNNIVDAAIETIGVACRLLPWHHYEIVLKHYLGKLKSTVEFQKQVVRIVATILDSFHYDLSKYQPTEKVVEQIASVGAESNDRASVDEEQTNQGLDESPGALGDQAREVEEELEEALNDNVEENAENVEEIIEKDNEMIKERVPIIERQTLLSQYGAKRVVLSISNDLLPQLQRAIVTRTRQDSNHKINRKKIAYEVEEDDLLRVPIALALVKLLQKMPERLLNANLPG